MQPSTPDVALPPSPARRALLIGIDDYPRLTKLDGCVNDARLVRSLLVERFGFPEANLTMLLDAEATREAILAALDALVAATGRDDVVVFQFAGHGSQMTDREGDEPSGLDSTLMPYDTEGWQGDNRDITDDELHLRLVALAEKTAYITCLVDACHSGTVTRDAFGAKTRGMPADTRPASALPPSPIPVARRTRGAARDAGPSGWLPLAERYVLLAGCRDEELSGEYRPPEAEGAVTHGALTYFLCQELRAAPAGATYRDVFERAAARVTAYRPQQHPQMEGRLDREVFGVRDVVPMRFHRVLARAGDVVTLAAGAALGATPGSRHAVYAQGTKETEGAEPLGEIEIVAVQAVTSEARILSERSPGAIAADARAVETAHAWGELRLPVELVADAVLERELADAATARLAALVEGSGLLRRAAEAARAAVRVYLLAPREAAGDGDPVPQLGAVAAPTWAAVGQDGQLVMPPKALDADGEVLRNLETIARYRQALALDNPNPESALRGRFTLDLLRRTPEGAWVAAEPEAAGGAVVFEEGEAIAFRVRSDHDQPAYVYLLDFGLTGSVSLVYPARGAQEQIVARGEFEVGTRPGTRAFTLTMPKHFPFAESAGHQAAVEGVETVKLFVTSGPVDFSFLAQQAVRSAQPAAAPGRARSGLQLLLESAARGPTTRDIGIVEPIDEEDWTTVARPFTLRRRRTRPLAADGAELVLGASAVLRTPGLAGEVQAHPWGSARAQVASGTQGVLAAVLAGAGAEVRQTIEIAGARPSAPPGMRSAPPAIALAVRDAGPDMGQMLLSADEYGVLSWHFAPEPDAERPRTRGAGAPGGVAGPTRTFTIPVAATSAGAWDGTGGPAGAPAGARPATRGLVSMVGRKVLQHVVFPLVDPLIGALSETFAARWEAAHRPYRVRSFTPDDYAAPEGRPIDGEAWRTLGAGRALLFVHGTFSRAHSAFGTLPRDFVEALHRQYEGRVFAFDHFTLSQDPRQNVNWLVDRLPDGTALDVDIVCHSRGGLVSRMLAERQGELGLGSRSLRVGKVVFVGTPNAGTALADPKHMGAFIDTYTTLLNFLPDNGVTEVLEGVVTVAKQLAIGAVKGLRGLQSMQPKGEFGSWLNVGARAGETRYFALSSDYTPSEPGLVALAKNRLMDKVFGASNDLVVPTDGVFAENGSGFFPIEDRHVFTGSDGVAHTTFFASRAAREKIGEWLRA